MKKLIIIIIFLFLCSCSVTIICSEKNSCIHGDGNKSCISGSHLKDNNFNQSAKGEGHFPISP